MLSKTEKSQFANLLPQLIIVEGFWRTGKTTLIKELIKQEQFNLINEPNHLIEAPNINNPYEWYFKKHVERHLLARQLMKKKQKVIMERSILSSIAFDYARRQKITKENRNILKKMPELKKSTIIFLYASKQFFESTIQKIKDDSVKNIINNKKFYSNYVNFYKKILQKIVGNNIFCLDAGSNGKLLSPNELIKHLVKRFKQVNSKEKVREICAAAVLVYKNKVLLLYDKNWNHYVLPQGHKEEKEKLYETAIREAIEETGYCDLKIVKKIKRYQYHYLKFDKVIYKTIHVYLVEILSLINQGKQLAQHENYDSCFLEFDKAIKQVRWFQDKKLIAISRNYLKR